MNIKIGKFILGKNKQCMIVAELSGNHNGNFQRMKKIIQAAKKAGADAVKLQTYTPESMTLNSKKKDFLIIKDTPWKKHKNMWNLYEKAHTPWAWHSKIFTLCKKLDLEVFSSPFDEKAIDLLESLNCPAYKVASAEINHIPLLEKLAKTKKPIILSLGLANFEDIKLAIKILKKNGNKKLILLQCVASYPSPLEEHNLLKIKKILKKFSCLSGLSDHTKDNLAPITAIALGASMIEKHFNLSDNIKTVDSFFSLNEKQFNKMVVDIRKVEKSLGKGDFKLSKSSIKNLNSKRSIYISKNIKKGEIVSIDNIKVIRPSFGLHPKFYQFIIGKKVNKNLYAGDRFKLEYINKK